MVANVKQHRSFSAGAFTPSVVIICPRYAMDFLTQERFFGLILNPESAKIFKTSLTTVVLGLTAWAKEGAIFIPIGRRR